MFQPRLRTDGPVPRSTQLFEQLFFAIATRQLSPGTKLPSVRQLAEQTGLHISTISRVYRQLDVSGVVEVRAGSGVYIKDPALDDREVGLPLLVRQTLDGVLAQGYSLRQVQEFFQQEIARRRQQHSPVVATARDQGALALMVEELEEALQMPIKGVLLDEVAAWMAQSPSPLVVTQRYHFPEVQQQLKAWNGDILALDLYNYRTEIELVEKLPQGKTLGVVSISRRILRVAETFVYSLRGQDLLVLTAQPQEEQLVGAILNIADLILTDETSYPELQQRALAIRQQRPLQLHQAPNYIAADALTALRQRLA